MFVNRSTNIATLPKLRPIRNEKKPSVWSAGNGDTLHEVRILYKNYKGYLVHGTVRVKQDTE